MASFLTNTAFLQISEVILLIILGFVLYQLINFRKIRKSNLEKKLSLS